ncbi:hypothetical protein Agub_g6781, partial [Astrephomene gubernaculifera]
LTQIACFIRSLFYRALNSAAFPLGSDLRLEATRLKYNLTDKLFTMLRLSPLKLASQIRSFCMLASSDAEKAIAAKLKESIKGVQHIEVQDTSGGCGAMYRIAITAEDFKDQPIVKQHQLVHRVLAEELKQWHGISLTTKSPAK